MKRTLTGIVLAAALWPLAAQADAPQPVQQHNSNAVWFENWTGLSNATMSIALPDGEVIKLFAASGTPVFELKGRDVLDGVYRYELTAATEETEKITNKIDNGRGENAKDTVAKPYFLAGAFVVSRGVIVPVEDIKEEE